MSDSTKLYWVYYFADHEAMHRQGDTVGVVVATSQVDAVESFGFRYIDADADAREIEPSEVDEIRLRLEGELVRRHAEQVRALVELDRFTDTMDLLGVQH